MFSALLGRALREQRTIVATGVGAGLLFALLLSLAVGGLYGSRPVTAAEAIGVALPLVLALGIWPLWALLAVSQAFTGDRAAGTEPFLLDRPVPPRRLFLARLLAALAGWGAVAGVTAAMSWILARAIYGIPAAGAKEIAAIGAVLSAIAGASAMLASALGAVSLAAALLGLLLALTALAIAFQLLRALPVLFESVGWFTLWPAVALVFAYPLVAWFAFTRGEPAGRARARLAAGVLGVAAAVIAAVFLSTTPALIRAGHRRTAPFAEVSLAPGGEGAVLNAWRTLWVVDPATGARRRFIPPWSSFLGWRPDGAMFAIATRATRLGGESRRERIAFLDRDGRRAAPDIELERDEVQIFGLDGLWVGEELFYVTASGEENASLWRVRPGDRAGSRVTAELPPLTRPLRTTEDGRLFLVAMRRVASRSEKKVGTAFEPQAELLRFDPLSGAIDSLGTISRGSLLYRGLSPSGRFWLVDTGEEGGARMAVRSIADGETAEYPVDGEKVLEWAWLEGDRLAIAVARGGIAHLELTGPGGAGEREPLASWRNLPGRGRLLAAPDGSMLLLRDHDGRRARVLHVRERRWTEIDAPEGPDGWRWAGERVLSAPGPGGIILVDVDDPSRRVEID